jgi:diguanylate cyclase (GGDEF)-like protein
MRTTAPIHASPFTVMSEDTTHSLIVGPPLEAGIRAAFTTTRANLNRITRLAVRVLGSPTAALYRHEGDRLVRDTCVNPGHPALPDSLAPSDLPWLRGSLASQAERCERVPAPEAIATLGYTTIMTAPLASADSWTAGVLVVADPALEPAQGAGTILFDLAALAMGQLELCRSLTASPAALFDLETGVYATPAFIALAEQQLKLARRSKRRIALLSITVDGEPKDDRATEDTVAEMAGVLKQTFRDSDLIARLGARELAVLAVEVQPGSLEPILSRTWENFEVYNSNRKDRVALSVAVSMFDPEQPVTLRELMAEAEKAMPVQRPGAITTDLSTSAS